MILPLENANTSNHTEFHPIISINVAGYIKIQKVASSCKITYPKIVYKSKSNKDTLKMSEG